MQWTMPRPVLQLIASLIGLAAVGAFALGIMNAPHRGGRLPGAKTASTSGPAAAAIEATEATPLVDERIEGPPPPTPEEIAAAKAKEEEAARKKEEEEAARAAEQAALEQALGNTPPPTIRPVNPPATSTPPAKPEEPIF
jgi:hypothetical protein